MKVGIQGGRGSFNEEALGAFLARGDVPRSARTVYCYTTHGVLSALARGTIDYGVFAIYNSKSLMVEETMAQLGRWQYHVVAYITMPVRHMLMTLPGVTGNTITQIVGHREALVQCRATLARDYADVPQRAGIAGLADGAAVAQLLAERDTRIPPTTAVLGSRAIATAYNLDILARDLHDDPHNTTTFLLVQQYAPSDGIQADKSKDQ